MSLVIPCSVPPSKGLIFYYSFIYFVVSFNQDLLISVGNLVTSTKFHGSGMKCGASEPDYPRGGNELFISFKLDFKNLCKTFPIFLVEIYTLFHSFCDFLIRSHILNLVSIALISG